MKLGQLSEPTFVSGLKKLVKLSLPIKTSYKLKKFVEKYEREVQNYDKLKNELVQKYAKRDETGNVVVTPENNVSFEREEFVKYATELNELNKIDVETYTINDSELGDSAPNFTTEELFALEGFLVFEEGTPVQDPPTSPVNTEQASS